MNKVIGIIIAIILIVGIVAIVKKDDTSSEVMTNTEPVITDTMATTTATSTMMTDTATTTTTKSYTMTEVAMHKDAQSCWSAISGKVYDLTKWIPQHPGGPEKILSICGKDGTSAFTGQHGENEKIVAGLVNFLIGDLK